MFQGGSRFRWKRRGKLGFGRGLGIASSASISGTNYPIYPNEMAQSAVQLKVDRSGVVTVFNGASEIGQGTDTLLATIVADELGLPLDCVRVVSADSDLCPVDLGAYSSRGTFMNGNACLHAARQVREKLVAAVAAKLQVPEASVFVTRGALCGKAGEQAVAVHEPSACESNSAPWERWVVQITTRWAGTIAAAPGLATSYRPHRGGEGGPETGMVEVLRGVRDCGQACAPPKSWADRRQRLHGRGRSL